jgi:predicted DNA-binding protein (MmcQ/YjbR family)
VHTVTKPSATTHKQFEALRTRGLRYPESHEDHPWGHSALKVKGKAFAFLHADAEGLSVSVKLPESNSLALNFPFAEPTGYGLGKSGWVSARFGPKEQAPLELLFEWLDESFRAIAPKRVVAQLVGDARVPEAKLEGTAVSKRTSKRAGPAAKRKAAPAAKRKAAPAAKPKAGPAAKKRAPTKRARKA